MKQAMIDIDTANSFKRYIEGDRAVMPDLLFRCPKCDQPLSAHRSGQGKQGPHFEHIPGNPLNCPPKK